MYLNLRTSDLEFIDESKENICEFDLFWFKWQPGFKSLQFGEKMLLL